MVTSFRNYKRIISEGGNCALINLISLFPLYGPVTAFPASHEIVSLVALKYLMYLITGSCNFISLSCTLSSRSLDAPNTYASHISSAFAYRCSLRLPFRGARLHRPWVVVFVLEVSLPRQVGIEIIWLMTGITVQGETITVVYFLKTKKVIFRSLKLLYLEKML